MPRRLAHFLVVVGWLLTPAWAWAASHVGLWLRALLALQFSPPLGLLAISGAGASLFSRSNSPSRSSCSRLPEPERFCSPSPCCGCGCGSCAICRTSCRITWPRARGRPRSVPRLRRIELLVLIAGVSSLHAQGRDVDARVGRWYQGNQSTSYELRTDAPLAGVFSHGLALQVLIHDSLGRHRAFYGGGWQLHALRHHATIGPYALAGASFGLSTDTTSQELSMLWSAGGGVEWRPVPWAAFGLEAVYRLQDVGPRGFWRAARNSRAGIAAAIGMSLTIGRTIERRGSEEHTCELQSHC